MSTSEQLGVGMARWANLAMNYANVTVQIWHLNQVGNLSGYGDPIEQFSGPVNLAVRLLKPRTQDEIVDPERGAGYMTDEYWTMLFPSSVAVHYRDLVTVSGFEGTVNYMVTQPTMTPWGNTT